MIITEKSIDGTDVENYIRFYNVVDGKGNLTEYEKDHRNHKIIRYTILNISDLGEYQKKTNETSNPPETREEYSLQLTALYNEIIKNVFTPDVKIYTYTIPPELSMDFIILCMLDFFHDFGENEYFIEGERGSDKYQDTLNVIEKLLLSLRNNSNKSIIEKAIDTFKRLEYDGETNTTQTSIKKSLEHKQKAFEDIELDKKQHTFYFTPEVSSVISRVSEDFINTEEGEELPHTIPDDSTLLHLLNSQVQEISYTDDDFVETSIWKTIPLTVMDIGKADSTLNRIFPVVVSTFGNETDAAEKSSGFRPSLKYLKYGETLPIQSKKNIQTENSHRYPTQVTLQTPIFDVTYITRQINFESYMDYVFNDGTSSGITLRISSKLQKEFFDEGDISKKIDLLNQYFVSESRFKRHLDELVKLKEDLPNLRMLIQNTIQELENNDIPEDTLEEPIEESLPTGSGSRKTRKNMNQLGGTKRGIKTSKNNYIYKPPEKIIITADERIEMMYELNILFILMLYYDFMNVFFKNIDTMSTLTTLFKFVYYYNWYYIQDEIRSSFIYKEIQKVFEHIGESSLYEYDMVDPQDHFPLYLISKMIDKTTIVFNYKFYIALIQKHSSFDGLLSGGLQSILEYFMNILEKEIESFRERHLEQLDLNTYRQFEKEKGTGSIDSVLELVRRRGRLFETIKSRFFTTIPTFGFIVDLPSKTSGSPADAAAALPSSGVTPDRGTLQQATSVMSCVNQIESIYGLSQTLGGRKASSKTVSKVLAERIQNETDESTLREIFRILMYKFVGDLGVVLSAFHLAVQFPEKPVVCITYDINCGMMGLLFKNS
jgi:hypothetical protein